MGAFFQHFQDFLYELVEMPDLASRPRFLVDFWVANVASENRVFFGKMKGFLVGGGVKYFSHFPPIKWRFMIQFDELFFSNRLVKNHQLDEIILPSLKLAIWHLFNWKMMKYFLSLFGAGPAYFGWRGFLGSKTFKAGQVAPCGCEPMA